MIPLCAEIISIGNEILAGYSINSNATVISIEMLSIGLPVEWVTTIADKRDSILAALQTADQRARVVLITGGLGPTPDDITKNCIAEFFNCRLVLDETVLRHVQLLLKGRGLAMLESNRRQALIPEGAIVLPNPIGTAPGLVMQTERAYFIFMPGVPVEMKRMVDEQVKPFLKAKLELPQVHNRLLRTTGIPESRLYELLKDLVDTHPQFPVAFLPRHIGVDLRFRLISNEIKSIQEFDTFVEHIKERAGKYIFTEESIELEECIGRLLAEQKLTLACAESFTGGLIGDLITNIPGSSNYFAGAVVAYSNESKIALLKVQPDTLSDFGAVSSQTALEMVRGVQALFKTDCALATTGIAGPGGGTASKPVGLCYIAARRADTEMVKEFHMGRDRSITKKRGAAAALEMLRRLLLNLVDQ